MVENFESDYHGVKRVGDSPMVGRLAEYLRYFLDMERALRLREKLNGLNVERSLATGSYPLLKASASIMMDAYLKSSVYTFPL